MPDIVVELKTAIGNYALADDEDRSVDGDVAVVLLRKVLKEIERLQTEHDELWAHLTAFFESPRGSDVEQGEMRILDELYQQHKAASAPDSPEMGLAPGNKPNKQGVEA